MGQKINIPSQNQPFRKQSSLGGDVSFRNLNGTNDNSFITLAKVTKVYYKQGKLDFKLTNTVSIVQEQGGDGSGSAPIPVDFFGRKPDGQVFGHYRPVKVGDLIAIAYINGHRSNPIVIGVYPDSAPDYEMISPSMFETGDDNDSGIAETGLAEQKVYPSMQTSYRSGSGTIAEALNGHSFLILDDETANQYDQLWTDYESVGFFNHDGETTNPLKEEAGSWLLVHEDNPDGDGDDHRTRFYVNPKGEIQIVLMGSNSEGDVSVLEGSRKEGFTLKHYNDLSSIKSGDKGQDVYNPDFDVAKKYVELNIGKDQSILMQAVDQGFSGGNTSLTVKSDGVYLNDKPLNASITDAVRDHSKEVANAISKDLTTTKEWEDFDNRVIQAGKDAKDAGDKAKQAGEDAKQAGISAEKAGEDAKKTGEDIKRHIIYYASAFPQGDHYIPGKYLAINTETYIANGIIKSAMIEDGAIDNAKIAYEAVGSSQIEDLAVTRGKLAYMAVGTAQIEDLAVSDEKVDHLSFNHMEGELLDAHKIRVRNLEGDSISAKTLTADKLIIGELGDITDKLGTIADGKIIVKGNGNNSGVELDGLDADNPDVYTPSKKAILINIVRAIKSSAEASLDYAKQVGLSNDPVAKDLQTKYDAMVDGLAPIFNNMSVSTNFDHNVVEKLTTDCNNAIDKFQNLANSQLNRKIGQTADNKNSVYQGYEQPANPHINDIWFQENSDGTYQIRVYDGGSWISPGMQDIKDVQESLQNMPRSYYQASAPTGTIASGSTWYKLERSADGSYTYTPYKWENKQWVKMLSSDQVVASHDIQNLQNDLKGVTGNLTKLSNQVIADKTNIQADYNGKIEDVNKVVTTNKTTTDKALNDNLNTAKGYADTKANDALTNAQTYAEGKVSSALASAQQYADGKANSALANAQTYADGKANGALANATKYIDTQLKISKEGLESQIIGTGGGVNLALTSDSDWNVPASNAFIGDFNKCIELSRYVLDSDTFSKGDTITYSVHLSFDGIQGNNPTMILQSVLSNNDWNHAIYPQCNINSITQNSSYEVTLKGTATLDPFPTALGTYILQIRFDRITAGTVKFCKVKIEKGSVATPYVASDTSYRSLIKATDRKIEGAVMKGTDYAGIIITPEHGFTAVANNMNFTLNKTAGFVINNQSDNIFKVDPSGNLTMKGNLVAGNISGVNFTGQSLNLAGSLKVSGSILSSNGNVAISSNGLTIKDGGLRIVNGNNETTTMIRDDGTFATNKGYFSGEVHTTKLILSGNDSDINMGGLFHVDSHGNVTATSIRITGNRRDDVSKLATIEGANITGNNLIQGNVIQGNTITGNTIMGGTINGSVFRTLNGQNILSNLSRPYFSDQGSKSFRISKSGLLTAENSVTKVLSNISSYDFTVGGNKGTFSNYIGYSGSTKNLTTDFYRYGVAQQESPSTQGVVGYYYYGNDNVPDGRADPKGTVILPVAWIRDNPGVSYMYLQYYLGVDASNVVNGNFRMVAFSTNYKPFSFSHDSTTGFDYLSSFNYDQFSFSNTDIEGKYIRSNNFHIPTGMDALYMDEFDLSSFPIGSDICFGIAIYPEQVADKTHPWGVAFTLESFSWGSVNGGDITLNVNGSHGSNVSSQSLNISNNGALSMEYVGDSSGGTNVDYSYINMNKGMIDLTASQPGYGTWKTMKTTISGTGIDFNTFNVDDPNNVHPITFRGTVTNTGGQTGIQFNGYGNIIANQASGNWSINVPSSTTPGQWTKVLQVPLKDDLPFEFHPEDTGNYGFLRLGWVKFKQAWYAGQKVPAIYNISDGHVAGIAIWSRYVTAFVDGWGLNLTDHNTPIAAGERVGVDVVGWSAGIP